MTPSLILITEATYEPVTDQQAIDHLREDSGAMTRIRPYLIAARQSIEEELISLKTTQRTYELQMKDWSDGFPPDGDLIVSASPLVSITSIKYDDANNVEQTLSASAYQADTSSLPGRIRYTGNVTLPVVYDKPNAIRIRFVAGYGAAVATDGGQSAVPYPIRAAILLRLGELYDVRTESQGGMITPVSLSVQRLISSYRLPI